MLTDPRVLVLDDATSSVDARTEEQIHATLRELMVGRTTVLIAHRRSTLRLADRIVLVADGAAAESGTHEELMATSPRYRALLQGPGDDLDDDEMVDATIDGSIAAVDGVASTAWSRTRSRAWPTASLRRSGTAARKRRPCARSSRRRDRRSPAAT